MTVENRSKTGQELSLGNVLPLIRRAAVPASRTKEGAQPFANAPSLAKGHILINEDDDPGPLRRLVGHEV
jgi:hypothetical protein